MDWRDRIVADPGVLVGKPRIRGTRIAVELLIELLAENWSNEHILESYPQWAVGNDPLGTLGRAAFEAIGPDREAEASGSADGSRADRGACPRRVEGRQ